MVDRLEGLIFGIDLACSMLITLHIRRRGTGTFRPSRRARLAMLVGSFGGAEHRSALLPATKPALSAGHSAHVPTAENSSCPPSSASAGVLSFSRSFDHTDGWWSHHQQRHVVSTVWWHRRGRASDSVSGGSSSEELRYLPLLSSAVNVPSVIAPGRRAVATDTDTVSGRFQPGDTVPVPVSPPRTHMLGDPYNRHGDQRGAGRELDACLHPLCPSIFESSFARAYVLAWGLASDDLCGVGGGVALSRRNATGQRRHEAEARQCHLACSLVRLMAVLRARIVGMLSLTPRFGLTAASRDRERCCRAGGRLWRRCSLVERDRCVA